MNFQSYLIRLRERGVPFVITLTSPTPHNVPGFSIGHQTHYGSHAAASLVEIGTDFVMIQYQEGGRMAAIPFFSILLIEESGEATLPEQATLESDA